jgi:hypothetical protein
MRGIAIKPGMRFGALTVVRKARSRNSKQDLVVRCDCNRERIVDGYNLASGNSRSCGNSVHGRHYKHGDANKKN